MKTLTTIFATGIFLLTYNGSANPPRFADFVPADAPQAITDSIFMDAQGKPHKLSDYKGNVVLLVFWATWCGPCVSEAEALDNLSAHFQGRPFKLLALSQDRNPQDVIAFFKLKNLKSTEMLFDSQMDVSQTFGIRGVPTAILINHKGEEVGRQQGAALWDSRQGIALIDYYLKQMEAK